MCVVFVSVFFFKQKTAYEMRISDWSSDVCSSDLRADDAEFAARIAVDHLALHHHRRGGGRIAGLVIRDLLVPDDLAGVAIERDHVRVQRGEDDLVAMDGRAAVHHVAAGHDPRSEEHTSELQSLMRI